MADTDHPVTVVNMNPGFDARCGCGWHSGVCPTRTVAEVRATRHMDEAIVGFGPSTQDA